MHGPAACPSCGSPIGGVDEGRRCPECGASLDPDDQIASWVALPDRRPDLDPVSPEPNCMACGYSGEMTLDAASGSKTCPACLATTAASPTVAASNVVRVIDCPECGQKIGLTKDDIGKTVVCSGCKSFLGTFPEGDIKAKRRGSAR
jgi:hypothetical protein